MWYILKLNHLTLPLLVATNFEMFASFDRQLFTCLAFAAFHSQHNLFGCFSLLTQNGLRLATKTLLFAIITTTSLWMHRFFTLFVLGHFVKSMLLALSSAVGSSRFWNVDHGGTKNSKRFRQKKTKYEQSTIRKRKELVCEV